MLVAVAVAVAVFVVVVVLIVTTKQLFSLPAEAHTCSASRNSMCTVAP